MRALGAIVIGIGAYSYDSDAFPQLRYSTDDADGIARYVETCWPDPEERAIIRLPEATATPAAIGEAFEALREVGPFDLLIVFLSGHGLASDLIAGFVTQPAPSLPTPSVIAPAELDRLLASIGASRTVLILDCCHAEGIVRRMGFFQGLGTSDARLFVASSREAQRTWEDDRIAHGIFTAHLLDLLNTGSSSKLKGLRDQLDVDGELFPVLCDQVPLYVLEHKHQRQEPVKGGTSIRAVTLPVARVARRIKERTALGTALRRVRQIGLELAAGGLTFLVAAYGLGYYAQADSNGEVTLRHGTKWLATAFRFLPTLRIDSGIAASDLSDDPARRYPVQAGETAGFWTHMSQHGCRAWYDAVRPSLDSRAAARYDVLLGSDAVRPAGRLDDRSKPSEVAFAAWALLDNSDPAQINEVLAHVPGADRIDPLLSPFSMDELDFNVLDLTQPELGSYADALRSTATVDPDRAFTPYIGFLKANQMWVANSSPEQHGREAQRRAADDVADVLAVIAKARTDRDQPALSPEMSSVLNQLAGLGYGDLVHLALARATAATTDRAAAAAQALAAFHGNSGEPTEAAALQQLRDALDPSQASQALVEQAYNRFIDAGGPEQSDLTAFLIGAADKGAIPSPVMTMLLDKASEALSRSDGTFMDSEYARILGHAMGQVPAASRPLAYALIDKVAASVTPLASSTAEIYTALGRQRLDTPAMFERVVTEAAAAPPFKPETPGVVAEPLPGMSIVVGHGPWLAALAVLGAGRMLPERAITLLEEHAGDPTLRDLVVRALLHQPKWQRQPCWTASCSKVLAAFPHDAAERLLTTDVLSEQLAALPYAEFIAALGQIRRERDGEIEPEVRIALGMAVTNAQAARVRTNRVGRQLLE